MSPSRFRFVLGSSSRSRRLILEEVLQQYPSQKPGHNASEISIITADLDERNLGDRSSGAAAAPGLVALLGSLKADAILQRIRSEPALAERAAGCVLVTGDQVITHAGRILEKPDDATEARAFLHGYSTSPCSTVGSVVLTDIDSGIRVQAIDTSTVHFRPIAAEAVDAMVAQGDLFYCAGALMIEDPLLAPFIDRIEGSIDSVQGLSKAAFVDLTAKLASLLDGKQDS